MIAVLSSRDMSKPTKRASFVEALLSVQTAISHKGGEGAGSARAIYASRKAAGETTRAKKICSNVAKAPSASRGSLPTRQGARNEDVTIEFLCSGSGP